MKELGHEGLNNLLVGFPTKNAWALCTFAYSTGPGTEPILFEGRTDGKIVPPRGSAKFGWDAIFEPIETGKTYVLWQWSQSSETRVIVFFQVRWDVNWGERQDITSLPRVRKVENVSRPTIKSIWTYLHEVDRRLNYMHVPKQVCSGSLSPHEQMKRISTLYQHTCHCGPNM